jgi:hypothetical protein
MWFIYVLALFLPVISIGQKAVYSLDLRTPHPQKELIDLPFSGISPDGTKLGVNNWCFEKNDQPWFPLMGEFHYIRYPEKYWEEEILKMKSAGLSVIATYVFWNAQEHPKGHWHWDGNLDLRSFITLCQKHHLYVWLRIGPWSHGEQLNGGFPDWIERMKGRRSNDPAYLAEAQKLFDQIGRQVKGLFFKDGGPVIGVQLENEYATGDINHIGTLKKMALKAGIHPVYFSITANTVFHDDKLEAIPLQGAYPYRGWETAGGKPSKDFLYANDQWIMTDALGKVYYDVAHYPKGTCEQGCGSQMTYQNRFVVDPRVVEAHLQNQIGRGMNMIGYYMFQGGTQMPGLKEPGLPESYDFQAPVSEFGFLSPSYKYLKILHNFLHDFGEDLAGMNVVQPENPVRDETDTDDLRYVARVNNNRGFVFLCNTQAGIAMPDKVFQMRLLLPGETIEFPRNKMHLKGQTTAVLPFNLEVNGSLLKYATAQPICRIMNGKEQVLFLTEVEGMETELAFDAASIQSLSAEGWTTENENGLIFLSKGKTGTIHLVSAKGQSAEIILLSRQQAENCWRLKIKGKEAVMITNADLMADNNEIELRQLNNPEILLDVFPALEKPALGKVTNSLGQRLTVVSNGIFTGYRLSQKKVNSSFISPELNDGKATIRLPETIPSGLSDIFLSVDYWGGAAELLADGKLATDNLFNGSKWMIGLKRFLGEKIELVPSPWMDNITGVNENLVLQQKQNKAQIRKIEVMPLYSSKLFF